MKKDIKQVIYIQVIYIQVIYIQVICTLDDLVFSLTLHTTLSPGGISLTSRQLRPRKKRDKTKP